MHTYSSHQYPHQVSTSYTIWLPKLDPDKVYRSRSQLQGQIKVAQRCVAYLPTPPNLCPYQVSTSCTLPLQRYEYKILNITTARSKFKSRSHHGAAHLHHLCNVSTTYQLPTPYAFRENSMDKIFLVSNMLQVKNHLKSSGFKETDHQNLTISSLCHCQHFLKVLYKSVHNFFNCFINTQMPPIYYIYFLVRGLKLHLWLHVY